MKTVTLAIVAAGLALTHTYSAAASEEQFLTSLKGQYEGTGQVRLRTNKGPINVSCSFRSTTTSSTLSLNGKCRGLVVVSRTIKADLTSKAGAYRGSYIGAGSGPATLAGKRSGKALNLTIRWAKEINGDRQARLSVAKSGSRGLTLTTTDLDPTTGKAVVTSKIVLQRK